MIEVKQVSRRYGKKQVLSDISFVFDKGEVIGLLGENGTGKSTLIEILCGARETTAGLVLCDEVPILDHPESKEKIAYIRDEQEHLEAYRGTQVIQIYKKFYPQFDIAIVNELNKTFGLDFGVFVRQYSKGQKMCLAFMLAMAQKADYIIMDEPFGGVDVGKQKFMKEYLIRELENREVGILLSTHNVDDLKRLCDRVMILKEGNLIKDGSIEKITSETVIKYEADLTEEAIRKLSENSNCLVKQLLGNRYCIYGDLTKTTDSYKTLLEQINATNIVQKEVSLEECYHWINGTLKEM